jgi:hypothetical protein
MFWLFALFAGAGIGTVGAVNNETMKWGKYGPTPNETAEWKQTLHSPEVSISPNLDQESFMDRVHKNLGTDANARGKSHDRQLDRSRGR